MASWAAKRQLLYAAIVAAFVLLILSYPTYKYFTPPPSCSDGKLNQNETGIDCGGPCARVCSSEVVAPIIHWERISKVSDGSYNALAYVENPNSHYWLPSVPYIFRLYDDNNILVSERHGTTYLPPSSIVPIFEGRIDTGQRIPVRATFEFESIPPWAKIASDQNVISVTKKVLSQQDTLPRIDATLSNTSLYDVNAVEVIAVVFDKDDNAIAFSKTNVDTIPRQSSSDVVFTWREPFIATSSRIEIIPRVNPASQ